MKDQTGKQTDRPFAPNKRDPNDKYKVRVEPSECPYKVEPDPNSKRPIVKKKD